MNKENKKAGSKRNYILYTFVLVMLATFSAIYSYSQFSKKEIITAVIQEDVNLNDFPKQVSAILTIDQQLSSGKNIPRGTRLIGSLNKEENNLVIRFNEFEMPNGKREQIYGKVVFAGSEDKNKAGISSKISKTLYHQTRSNVLGAIFYGNSGKIENISGDILSKGRSIKIEID